MLKSLAHLVIAIALFAATSVAGLLITSRLVPDRLREFAAAELGTLIGSPVQIERASVRLGRGLVLQGENLTSTLDSTPGDPEVQHTPNFSTGLHIGTIRAEFELSSALLGRLSIERLELVDAVLRVERKPDGTLRPELVEHLLDGRLVDFDAAGESRLSRLPAPAQILEGTLGFLLNQRPGFPDWQLRGSTIVYHDAVAGPPDSASQISLRGIEAELLHFGSMGGGRLALRGTVHGDGAAAGRIEWLGRRLSRGPLDSTLAFTNLRLSPWRRYVGRGDTESTFSGRISGAISFSNSRSTSAPSSPQAPDRLEIDVVMDDFLTDVGPPETGKPLALAVPRARAHVFVELDDEWIQIRQSEFAGQTLDFELEGRVPQPQNPSKLAKVSISLQDMELARLFDRIRTLTGLETPSTENRRLQAGSLRTVRATGEAPIRVWEELLGGRATRLPQGFEINGEVSGVEIAVNKSDWLEVSRGLLQWSGDSIHVRDTRSMLNGTPLPSFDVKVEGVSHLFAADPAHRTIRSGGSALIGLASLWEFFSDPQSESEKLPTSLSLQIEELQHPMFLWPIADLVADIEPSEGGIRSWVHRGLWAGVPVVGEARWLFAPEEHVEVRLAAKAPPPTPTRVPILSSPILPDLIATLTAPRVQIPMAPESPPWGTGHFTLGPMHLNDWHQSGASGSFDAKGATFYLDDVEIALEPAGQLTGSGRFDLGRAGAVPYEVDLHVSNADLGAVTVLFGLEEGWANGQVDLAGRFRGSLDPNAPFLSDFKGPLSVSATSGSLKRGIPPLVTLAMSTDALNPFASRERVRFDRVDTTLDFDDSLLRADAFILDGTDARVFASGSIVLGGEENTLKAEVAVFLFRVLDRALESIPVVNQILLGEDESIVAAHYALSGTWQEPAVQIYPIRTLASGPASLLFERFPQFLQRSFEAIGNALRGESNGQNPIRPELRLAPPG
ncbi:AsmA-like C-terminal region-containing protein [Myxococcota bacterium]|nr:AsmA-like C-terminal region-containing protein [Myxococcota bacterium]